MTLFSRPHQEPPYTEIVLKFVDFVLHSAYDLWFALCDAALLKGAILLITFYQNSCYSEACYTDSPVFSDFQTAGNQTKTQQSLLWIIRQRGLLSVTTSRETDGWGKRGHEMRGGNDSNLTERYEPCVYQSSFIIGWQTRRERLER